MYIYIYIILPYMALTSAFQLDDTFLKWIRGIEPSCKGRIRRISLYSIAATWSVSKKVALLCPAFWMWLPIRQHLELWWIMQHICIFTHKYIYIYIHMEPPCVFSKIWASVSYWCGGLHTCVYMYIYLLYIYVYIWVCVRICTLYIHSIYMCIYL